MQQFTGSLVSYPARVSFGAYVLAILLGGLILTTPLSRNPGCEPITLVDGIFTATSRLLRDRFNSAINRR